MVDQCNGLVVSAAAERIGGFGRVMNLFSGRCPSGIDCVRWMNFKEPLTRSVVHVQTELLQRLEKEEPEDDEPLTYVNLNSNRQPEPQGKHESR